MRALATTRQRLDALERHKVPYGQTDIFDTVDPDTQTAMRYLDGTKYPSMFWKGAPDRENGKPHGQLRPEVYPYYGDPKERGRDVARGCIPVVDHGRQVTGQSGDLLYYRYKKLQDAELSASAAESRARVAELYKGTEDSDLDAINASRDSRLGNMSRQLDEAVTR